MTELNNLKEEMKTEVTDSKGEAGGLAPLDEEGKVPAANLPTGEAGGVAGLDEEGKVPVENLPVGEEGGVAPLDETGKVPSQYLPSYVDDVIEGTLGEDGVFMTVPDPDVPGDVAKAVTGEKGKIYVDVNTNFSYRWSGHVYVKIESNDLVEITAEDVQAMWDAIQAKQSGSGEEVRDPIES